jgi:hypothetical protein
MPAHAVNLETKQQRVTLSSLYIYEDLLLN